MIRRVVLGVVVGLMIGSLSGAPASAAPELVFSAFDPLVIRVGDVGPVLFQAKVAGSPTRVVLVLNALDGSASDRAMRDDGTAGDRVRADGIYTTTLTTAEIVGLLRPDDVLRAEVGFLDVYEGTIRAVRGNVFADVITSEVPLLPVTRVAPDAQRTDYLVNIVLPGFVTAQAFDIVSAVRRFYALFPDEFDFLNLVAVSTHFRNRFHLGVKSEVRGIGVQPFDDTARYGSSGRLLGITVFPIQSVFDGAEAGYQHELGHQWINFLPIAPLNYVIPHWPLSDLAGGIMGFAETGYGEGLQFPCIVTPVSGGATLTPQWEPLVFNDLDLYLMGLLPASEVGTHFVFPLGTKSADLFALCDSGTWRGQLETVTIGDIVGHLGPRAPDSAHGLHSFRVATVIVSSDGLLSEEVMAFYSYFVKRAEATEEVLYHSGFAKGTAKPFFLSTRQLGSLDTRIVATQSTPAASARPTFDAITSADLLARTASLSSEPINGSDAANALRPGTIVLYRTSEGRYGKLEVLESGYDLVLRFVTYDANGTVHSASDRLVVPGTYLADLDRGTVTDASADFQWSQRSETVRYLEPTRGAMFAPWPQ